VALASPPDEDRRGQHHRAARAEEDDARMPEHRKDTHELFSHFPMTHCDMRHELGLSIGIDGLAVSVLGKLENERTDVNMNLRES
jgi:hypothetical protein